MTVSVHIIAYNEELTLPDLLRDIEEQTYPREKTEIVLINSASTDHTAQVIADFAAKHSDFLAVRVGENPKRVTPAAWNAALRLSSADVIIHMDAHARIEKDFIEKNMRHIAAGEDIVGGYIGNFSLVNTPFGDAVNKAEDAMFGGSFASFRRSEESGYVDTLGFAAYRKEVFETVGIYNEQFLRTEDNDMHYRMRKAGYKFFYTPEIRSMRKTRNSLLSLLKQKFLNGYWIGQTSKRSPKCFSTYHFVPFLFLLAILGTSLLAGFGLWFFAAAMWGAYSLVLLASVVVAFLTGGFNLFYLLLPVMLFALHIGYGVGTLIGFIHSYPFKEEDSES